MEQRTYISNIYSEDSVESKYIGFMGDDLTMFEVDKKGQTLKSYPINPADVEKEFTDKARDRRHTAFNQVKIWSRR